MTPHTLGAFVHLLASKAWTGVDLFFVLSGFLLGGILLDHRSADNTLRVFYARRIFRISPLYFAFLAVMSLMIALWPGRPAWVFKGTMPLWSYWLYVQNFAMAARQDFGAHGLAPTWSLAVEEQFYLILPLLILLVPQTWLLGTLMALIASAPVLRTLLIHYNHGGIACYVLLPAHSGGLFMGVAGAVLVRRPGFVEFFRQRPWALYIPLILLGAVMGFFGAIFNRWTGMAAFTWYALFYLTFILTATLLPSSSFFRRVLRVSWLARMGAISYCVYLIHEPVSGLCYYAAGYDRPHITGWTTLLLTALSVAITIGIATISYRYFESPLVRLGHRFKYQNKTDASPRPGATAPPAPVP